MPQVSVELESGIAIVRIDRPPANAMDPGLVEEIIAAAESLRGSRPKAIVLTGREGFFSAGLDLKAMPLLAPDAQKYMVLAIDRMVASWYSLPLPVVCAVNGHAIAGGLILALCGDHRVGSTAGKLGLTEVRVGIPYPAAAIALVRAELSPAAARTLTLHGELLDPPMALQLGLVDELAEPDRVQKRALEVAAELSALPSETYARVKQQLRGDLIAELERIVAENDDPLTEGWLSPETEVATSAALREPTNGSPPA